LIKGKTNLIRCSTVARKGKLEMRNEKLYDEKLLLNRNDVAMLLGVEVITIELYIKQGLMPPRIVLSSKTKGWFKEDIVAWLRSKRESGNGRVHEVQGTPKAPDDKRRRVSGARRRGG